MTVIPLGNKSEKEGFFGKSQRPTVGQQNRNGTLSILTEIGPYDFSYFCDIIFHRTLTLRVTAGQQQAHRLHQRKYIFPGIFRV